MVLNIHVEIRGLDGIAGPEGRTIERALPASALATSPASTSLHEDRFGEAPRFKHTFLGGSATGWSACWLHRPRW